MPRLHDDELVIDDALVRGLLESHHRPWARLPLTRLESTGSTNVLFRLGQDLLVRLPRQPGGSRMILAEAHWTPRLSPALSVPVPEVVAVGQPTPIYSEHWSVVRWIAGDHPEVVLPDGPPSDSEQLAEDLAAFIQSLRAAPIPTDLPESDLPRSYRGTALADLDPAVRDNLARCRALGDFGYDLDAAEHLWEEALRLPGAAETTTACWYHGDLTGENLLVRNGRLAAVLDFGPSVGDPTVDLVVAWQVLDPAGRELFRERLGVDDTTWAKGRAWALCISLMVWYYWHTLPGRRAAQVAVGRNVLADAGL
ncbi:MAG TPA: aminoglycoside phosphotransferase family protein [Candidatus Avipropionibacterium avicola]|uniref:Aminoglycoside phosphotransferase family protein n=1 Tax=Candidatus Avipropionibacterium avicola TaxID=2840701 RepID=A0A9D1GY57_9ACTN|nr:aminoglycoside phosphotransferase family protein [Candidatus Avipropionibacterium avicola]